MEKSPYFSSKGTSGVPAQPELKHLRIQWPHPAATLTINPTNAPCGSSMTRVVVIDANVWNGWHRLSAAEVFASSATGVGIHGGCSSDRLTTTEESVSHRPCALLQGPEKSRRSYRFVLYHSACVLLRTKGGGLILLTACLGVQHKTKNMGYRSRNCNEELSRVLQKVTTVRSGDHQFQSYRTVP